MTTVQKVAQCAKFATLIAMTNCINANVFHHWRKLVRCGDAKAATKTGEFNALTLTMALSQRPPITSKSVGVDLHVELRCGAITMSITWPNSATAEFALGTRNVLG